MCLGNGDVGCDSEPAAKVIEADGSSQDNPGGLAFVYTRVDKKKE